ncbi:hypothetical protein [Hymenobacter sp. BRD128]|uniref:hypothetical protein n=1 Tax=Hymenobacter sp. BRD128 TaxID=2675878 RepID=UPI0020B712DA|nr:hypothetical protein [Hymenobacter sp. BRD128]
MRTKRFLGTISLAVALNLLVKPGWVLLENIVQDRLGHGTFGLIAACSALAVVVATFADLGLTQFTVQRLAAEPTFADSQFPTLFPLRGLLTGARCWRCWRWAGCWATGGRSSACWRRWGRGCCSRSTGSFCGRRCRPGSTLIPMRCSRCSKSCWR